MGSSSFSFKENSERIRQIKSLTCSCTRLEPLFGSGFGRVCYLIVHGAVKLLLVGGLAANKRSSYPVAIVAFTAFTVNQLYLLRHQYSLFLGIVTFLDVIFILLNIQEYGNVGKTIIHQL